MYRLLIFVFITGIYAQDNSFSCEQRINLLKDDSYWYGYGIVKYKKMKKNKSLEAAKEVALGDLASKINTKIESFVSINSSEIIKNNRTKFVQSSSNKIFTSTSAEIGDYEIDFSGPCSKKEYLVTVKLSQDSFFLKQESVLKQYLSESNQATSNDNLFQNKLLYIDQTYQSLIDIGRLVGISSGLLDRYYKAISRLRGEYNRMISDIDIKINIKDSFVYHANQSSKLKIEIKDKLTHKILSDLPVKITYLSSELNTKTDSEGMVEILLPSDLKKYAPFDISATVLLDKNLKNHSLFNLSEFENPNKSKTLEIQRLRINQIVDIQDDFLSKALSKSFSGINNKIQQDLKVSFSSNNPFFTIKIQAEEVVVRKNNSEIFIVQFVPVITLINNTSNQVVYIKTLSKLKGLSFQSYDKAYKEAVVGLNRELKGVADGIIKAIL
jgi:hypothetical protein